MVSTFGSLNTVVTGLQNHQLALSTTGHNLTNASTPGYSRQRVNLVASNAQTIYTNGGPAQLGMGVTSQSIIRIRDTFIDRQYWKENSLLGTNQTVQTYLNRIEDVFGEPKENGLETILNNFWDSLQTVSTDASNHSTRAVAIQTGVSLCTTIQQEVSQLKNLISDINLIVKLRVNSINQITEELLSLNKQIAAIEAGKIDHANDLRDRRDYLVDQLSYMIDLQVTEDDNGAYLIYGGGVSLVTATSRQELATQSHMDGEYGYEVVEIVKAGTSDKLTFKNGEVAALLDVRDSDWGVKKYLDDLANMAKFLLQEFNDVHKAGVDLNGDAGDNFFGKAGVDYTDPADPDYPATKGDWLANLFVSDELTDPSTGTWKLAARESGEGIGDGKNAVNLSICLKDTATSATLGYMSLDTYYHTQMGALGTRAENAEHMAENQQAIIDQLLELRESVCGVNEEEELTDMIRFQKAYNAAARILTAMDEMLDKLINGTGRVGV